jgi:hypothetical protein
MYAQVVKTNKKQRINLYMTEKSEVEFRGSQADPESLNPVSELINRYARNHGAIAVGIYTLLHAFLSCQT